MFENVRAEKRRSDPDRAQRRDETKLKSGDRGCDKGPRGRLLITAGTDERDRAFMLCGFRVGVDQFVPARRHTERKRRQNCGTYPTRDCAAKQRRR